MKLCEWSNGSEISLVFVADVCDLIITKYVRGNNRTHNTYKMSGSVEKSNVVWRSVYFRKLSRI